MPAPTTTGGFMSYASTVDIGQVVPQALYDGDLSLGNTGTLSANTVYLAGVTLLAPATLTAIRLEFASGANGYYDVGIYDSTGTNAAAGNLLAHAAATNTTLATPSSGRVAPSFIGGNLALSPGRYWFAFWISNASDTVQRQAGNSQMSVSQTFSSTGPLGAVGSLSDTGTRIQMLGLLSGGFS